MSANSQFIIHSSALLLQITPSISTTPRGHRTILSPNTIVELRAVDKHHPRLQKNYAAQFVISHFIFRFDPCPKHHLSPNSTPHEMKHLCLHFNQNYLTQPSDTKLSHKSLWQIIHRLHFHDWKPTLTSAIHEAYYHQVRYITPKKSMISHQKKQKPSCTNTIGHDFRTLQKKKKFPPNKWD